MHPQMGGRKNRKQLLLLRGGKEEREREQGAREVRKGGRRRRRKLLLLPTTLSVRKCSSKYVRSSTGSSLRRGERPLAHVAKDLTRKSCLVL